MSNETAELFDEFQVLSTMGIEKPVFKVHRMWAMMAGERIKAESDFQVDLDTILVDEVRGENPEIGSMATFDAAGDKLYVFTWNYHDEEHDFPDADISVSIADLPKSFAPASGTICFRTTHCRIDDQHSNAYSACLRMGSPQDLMPAQYAELLRVGKLECHCARTMTSTVNDGGGEASFEFSLPARAMSLILVEREEIKKPAASTVGVRDKLPG